MHPFFSLSQEFYKYRHFIYTIYGLAVLDILTTFATVWTGGIELNPFGNALIGNPAIFAAWRISAVTILILFPYKFSDRFNPAHLSWLALLGASLFPVANNLIMLCCNILF